MNTLFMAIHNHQPAGNIESIFEEAYIKAYKPFMDKIKDREIWLSLHISGSLFDFFEQNHPTFLDQIALLVESGQLELLSGGYYEPVLSAIPRDDAIGQLSMMNKYLKKRFGIIPKGFWLTERIWDDSIIDLANEADLKYTIVDDTHLFYAGKIQKDVYKPMITEKHGKKLTIFPVDKHLRHKIPFSDPSLIEHYIKKICKTHKTTSVFYGDIGEKFGIWPGSEKWVYEEGWFDRFLTMIEESEVFSVEQLGSAYDSLETSGRVYLPPSSYEEMMEWALPVEQQEEYSALKNSLREENRWEQCSHFFKGAIWNNFFEKYFESNLMHKRSLILSNRIREEELNAEILKKKNPITIEKAKKYLYKSQDNTGYWHGLFGGIYHNHLRDAIYKNIILGENTLDFDSSSAVSVQVDDFLANGKKQIVLRNSDICLGVDETGSILFYENRKKAFSLSNTLTRRKEIYHSEDVFEPDVEIVDECSQDITYDPYPRKFFMEHISWEDISLTDFCHGTISKIEDLWQTDMGLKVKTKNESVEIRGVLFSDADLKFTKKIIFHKFEHFFTIEHTLKNESDNKINCYFAAENNFSLLTKNDPLRYLMIDEKKVSLDRSFEKNNVSAYEIHNEWDRFIVTSSFSTPAKLLSFPVETLTSSENKLFRSYQGTAMLAVFPLSITPGKSEKIHITYTIDNK